MKRLRRRSRRSNSLPRIPPGFSDRPPEEARTRSEPEPDGATGAGASGLAVPDHGEEAIEKAVAHEHLGRLPRGAVVHAPQRRPFAALLLHLDEDLLVASEHHWQVLVDLGGEGVDPGATDRDGREQLRHLLVQDPHVGDDDGGAALRALASRVDRLPDLVGDRPVFLLGLDTVADHQEDRVADVEVAWHQRMSRASSRNSSVSAWPRSWNRTLSVAVTTAPACRS